MKEVNNIEISEKEYEKLKRLAYHDNLTGCYNRNWFVDFFNKDDEFKFIIVDINGLKKENDTNGHAAGDKLIKEVASSLMQHGQVIRYGGDEFILIAPKDFDVKLLNSDKYCYGWFVKDNTNSLSEVFQLADYCLNMRKRSLKTMLKKGFNSKKLAQKQQKLQDTEQYQV